MKENQSNASPREEKEPIEPDFLLIDEREGKKKYRYFGKKVPFWKRGVLFFRSLFQESPSPEEAHEEESSAKKSPRSISLRFICFLGWIFCLIFGLGMFLWSLLMTLFALLSLFCHAPLNQATLHFWKLFLNTLIAALGFTVGLLFPSLGLKWVALYLAFKSRTGQTSSDDPIFQADNEAEEDILEKVLRGFVNRME